MLLIERKAKKLDWKTETFKIIRGDGFVTRVKNFDRNDIPKNVKDYIISNYTSDPSYDPEMFGRASAVLLPLTTWL